MAGNGVRGHLVGLFSPFFCSASKVNPIVCIWYIILFSFVFLHLCLLSIIFWERKLPSELIILLLLFFLEMVQNTNQTGLLKMTWYYGLPKVEKASDLWRLQY